MVQGLFLDGIARKGGDQTVDKRVERATPILPRAAPTYLSISEQAAPLAGEAADLAVDWLLQQSMVDEW